MSVTAFAKESTQNIEKEGKRVSTMLVSVGSVSSNLVVP